MVTFTIAVYNNEEEGLFAFALARSRVRTRVLAWSLAATSAFVVIELASGLRAHSLALISDAGHNATDALALLLAWFAVYLQGKPADESRTFGYHRAGVLAAFVNALTLIVLSVWILYESWQRLLHSGRGRRNGDAVGGRAAGWLSMAESCWACTAPAATTSTCGERSCTCWAICWARPESWPERW